MSSVKSSVSLILVVWDEWVAGGCSAGCGSGTIESTRICLHEQEDIGVLCEGEKTKSEPCDAGPC